MASKRERLADMVVDLKIFIPRPIFKESWEAYAKNLRKTWRGMNKGNLKMAELCNILEHWAITTNKPKDTYYGTIGYAQDCDVWMSKDWVFHALDRIPQDMPWDTTATTTA